MRRLCQRAARRLGLIARLLRAGRHFVRWSEKRVRNPGQGLHTEIRIAALLNSTYFAEARTTKHMNYRYAEPQPSRSFVFRKGMRLNPRGDRSLNRRGADLRDPRVLMRLHAGDSNRSYNGAVSY